MLIIKTHNVFHDGGIVSLYGRKVFTNLFRESRQRFVQERRISCNLLEADHFGADKDVVKGAFLCLFVGLFYESFLDEVVNAALRILHRNNNRIVLSCWRQVKVALPDADEVGRDVVH